MKLELGKIFINDIQFAEKTEIKDHVLYVSKKELSEVFLSEEKIKEDTQATIRCVPFMFEQTEGVDMVSGKPAKHRVLIARSY